MVLFRDIPQRELRAILAENGIQPVGVRPASGRGRPPMVFASADVCDVLGQMLA